MAVIRDSKVSLGDSGLSLFLSRSPSSSKLFLMPHLVLPLHPARFYMSGRLVTKHPHRMHPWVFSSQGVPPILKTPNSMRSHQAPSSGFSTRAWSPGLPKGPRLPRIHESVCTRAGMERDGGGRRRVTSANVHPLHYHQTRPGAGTAFMWLPDGKARATGQ